MIIRDEIPGDVPAIREVIAEAFKSMPYSRQTEVAIYDGLRTAGAMTVALVAEEEGAVVGHIVLSPVTIGGTFGDWLGAGPLAVRPDRQGRGIGCALVATALERARRFGAPGCVLVGDPAFYGRFGFAARAGLVHEGVPDQFVMGVSLGAPVPEGRIRFHPAFDAE
ncbi:N-acetyltransferase [Telmatospirillum sp.]|uniref:GNAT family N-acetyltransferase n=1 Tax=Telmatospirillum sp. TaxID=2079197 RepID=UPI002851AF3F|nr:N-acetyltransferase [Telmatospirillum sp.]MDR3435104.1 N-acetyltransferase [Telmatospirillum sp.]